MAAKAVAGPTDFTDGQTLCSKEEKETEREMPLSKGQNVCNSQRDSAFLLLIVVAGVD